MLIWLCLVLLVHRTYVILFHPWIILIYLILDDFSLFPQSVCVFFLDICCILSVWLCLVLGASADRMYPTKLFNGSHMLFWLYRVLTAQTESMWSCLIPEQCPSDPACRILAVPTGRMWSHLMPLQCRSDSAILTAFVDCMCNWSSLNAFTILMYHALVPADPTDRMWSYSLPAQCRSYSTFFS